MTKSRKTKISWVEAEDIVLRGYKIENLIGRISLSEAIYLLLLGEMPPKNHALMLEAILVSVIDHGVRPPSTITCVTVANTGSSLNSAVAADYWQSINITAARLKTQCWFCPKPSGHKRRKILMRQKPPQKRLPIIKIETGESPVSGIAFTQPTRARLGFFNLPEN